MDGPMSRGSEAEKVDVRLLDSIEEGTAETKSETSKGDAHSDPSPYASRNFCWTSSPGSTSLIAFTRQIHVHISWRFSETYPRTLDTLRRILKLIGLTLVVIFVVMLASWIMILSHWFTVVFGHIILHYTVPPSLDDEFAIKPLDYTMLFTAIGAFVVNLPPFIIFLLTIPWTFERAILERSTTPVNDFIARITPHSRLALLLIKYTPRLSAGPIGCAILRAIPTDENDNPEVYSLDPFHAAMAGLAGEGALSCMGYMKGLLRKHFENTKEPYSRDSLPI